MSVNRLPGTKSISLLIWSRQGVWPVSYTHLVVTTVLMLHLPQVERVIMEQGVNTSLLQYAASLMKGEHEGKKAGSGLSPEREEGSFCAE